MPGLTIGERVWIRCKVQPGPFSEEPLVTVDAIDGAVSGFINRDELKSEAGENFVRGVVRAIERDRVEVWIRGSFFTTNGLASVPRELTQAA